MLKHKRLKLDIELVPSSSWGLNLRNLLMPKMWKKLREEVVAKYNNRCAVCGKGGKLHAHEVWNYDDKNHIQKLKDIITLCTMCHATKHIGLAGIQASEKGSSYENLIKHFMKVNNCSREVFEKHLKSAFQKFEERSHYEWQIDLTTYRNRLK